MIERASSSLNELDGPSVLIAAVKAYALANYDKGEWGLIAEVYTDQEIGDLVANATSEKQAIGMVRRYLAPVASTPGYSSRAPAGVA